MDCPEAFADSFPQSRDNEPASLRQDIADELADHLQTALRRQLLTTPDETSARSQVVARFGNPQRLARQLWLEAMQEKIMSQRLMFAATALLSIVCLVAVGMMWRVVEQGQVAARELLDETRTANRALMERLSQLSSESPRDAASPGPAKSVDWNPFVARLVLGEKSGPPAEGMVVRLSQTHSKNGGREFETVAEERTGSDGIADLGLFPPGKYELSAMRFNDGEYFSTPVTVLPGSAQTVEIVCPLVKVAKVGVVIRAEVPEDLRRKDLYLTVELILAPRDFSGSEWRMGFNGAQSFDSQVVIIIAPDGRVGLTYQGIMNHPVSGERIQMIPSDKEGEFWGSPTERPVEFFLTSHYFKTVRIGSPVFPVRGNTGQKSITPGWLDVKSAWHFLSEDKRIYPGPFDYRIANRDLASLPTFKIVLGQDNEWQLTIPEEFWTQVRADLVRAERLSQETAPAPAAAY